METDGDDQVDFRFGISRFGIQEFRKFVHSFRNLGLKLGISIMFEGVTIGLFGEQVSDMSNCLRFSKFIHLGHVVHCMSPQDRGNSRNVFPSSRYGFERVKVG